MKTRTILSYSFAFTLLVLSVFLINNTLAFQHNSGATIRCVPKQGASVPADIAQYPDDIRQIINRGVITIAMKRDDSAPFFFQTDQGIFGLDIELGCAIAQELGVEARFVRGESTFNGVANSVARGEADIAISKLSDTLQRERKLLFTDPYAKFTHGFLINRERISALNVKGNKYDHLMQSLRKGELELGVIGDSSYEYFAQQNLLPELNEDVSIIPYDTWDNLVQDVIEGEIAIAYRDIMEVKNVLKERPELVIKLRPAIISSTNDSIAIAVNARNEHLHFWLNGFIERHILSDTRIRKRNAELRNACKEVMETNIKRDSQPIAISQFCNTRLDYYDADTLLKNDFENENALDDFTISTI